MTRTILLDIEGTTTPIEFVHQVLFPYSKEHLPEFVREHANDPTVRACLDQVHATCVEEGSSADTLEAQIHTLLAWIAGDRKHTALKNLQGLIWKHGYESGAYISSLYDDVYPCLKKWRDHNIDLAIYSSGSVQAQKLLFGHTKEGDLNPLFSNYFDTQVGHKQSKESYSNIRESLSDSEIWFLSDVAEELDAAKTSGIHTVQLVRPGTTPCDRHPTAKDFFEVDLMLFE